MDTVEVVLPHDLYNNKKGCTRTWCSRKMCCVQLKKPVHTKSLSYSIFYSIHITKCYEQIMWYLQRSSYKDSIEKDEPSFELQGEELYSIFYSIHIITKFYEQIMWYLQRSSYKDSIEKDEPSFELQDKELQTCFVNISIFLMAVLTINQSLTSAHSAEALKG